MPSVLFPVGAVISAICVSDNAEMDVHGVGREGMIGGHDMFSFKQSRFDLVCQIGGDILSMPTSSFGKHFARSVDLRRVVSDYAVGLLTFMTQSVACNGLHTVAQRCARWLLVTRDRVGVSEFSLTHELLARMLGVRRSGVSVAVKRLARAGVIRYRFGRLRIIEPQRLEAESCDCYRVVVRETRRLLRASSS
jgi:CRP-like cAMP-binding protein